MLDRTILDELSRIRKAEDLLTSVNPVVPSFFRGERDGYEMADLVQGIIEKKKLYNTKPLAFLENELGISTVKWEDDLPPSNWSGQYYPLWSKQRVIIPALSKYKKVAVRSGHGLGKTYIAAAAVFWLMFVRKALGITTAPKFRQVKRLLWAEIHNMYRAAPRPLGGKMNQTSFELGPKWFCEGFSTDDPEGGFQGFHEENVFVIVDEAGAVDPVLYDVLDTVLTNEHSYVLLIGNPVDAEHPFADFFKPNSDFYQVHMNVMESPNVKHGWNIYPKLTSCDWPKRMRKKWSEDSPWWKSRVLGEFPETTSDVFIPYKYILAALDRDLSTRNDRAVSLGCDIARKGSDESVICVRWSSGRYRIERTFNEDRVPDICREIVRVYEKYRKHALKDGGPCINVDDIGVGGGVTDVLTEKGLPVNPIIVSETPEDFFNDDDEYEANISMFYSKKEQFYWNLKKQFEMGRVDIDDEELAVELQSIRADVATKIKIWDKKRIKKILGHSPDRAEAMMLASATDEILVSDNIVRWI